MCLFERISGSLWSWTHCVAEVYPDLLIQLPSSPRMYHWTWQKKTLIFLSSFFLLLSCTFSPLPFLPPFHSSVQELWKFLTCFSFSLQSPSRVMYRSNLGTYIDVVITVHYIGEIPLGEGWWRRLHKSLTAHPWIRHFKWVNGMWQELRLRKSGSQTLDETLRNLWRRAGSSRSLCWLLVFLSTWHKPRRGWEKGVLIETMLL